MYRWAFLLLGVVVSLAFFLAPAEAGLSIVADLDSNATNGPDSTDIDVGDTLVVHVWITGEDSLYSFGITLGDSTGDLSWVEDTTTAIYMTPNGWTDIAVYTDSNGLLLLQSTDFSVNAPLHTPYEVARLKFQGVTGGECPDLVGDLNMSGWMDTNFEELEFDDFEGPNICVNEDRGEGRGSARSGGLSSDADWLDAGESAADSYGTSVATAGDINGDGYSDILAGAPHYFNGDQDTLGAVYVYLGSASGVESSPDTILVGEVEHSKYGFSVATGGDLNGDGIHDVLIGAPEHEDSPSIIGGVVFVYLGSETGLALDTILESGQSNAEFGFSVAWAGEVADDRFDDIVVGAPGYDDNDSFEGGVAFIYEGSASGLVNIPDDTLTLDNDEARFGFSVATAGDVNADGYSDVIIGAPSLDDGGTTNAGAAFVYRGAASGLNSTHTWSDTGTAANVEFGATVSTAGDVDGNGYSDVVVGAPGSSSDQGLAYIYQGYSSGLADTVETTLDMSQAGAEFGTSVATAGDVDGDGYADVIVGAPLYDNGETNEGAAFVYFGSDSGLVNIPVDTLDSDQAEAKFGAAVSTAGDVDGRGYSDVIIGAPAYSDGSGGEGGAFVFLGDIFLPDTTAVWAGTGDQSGAAYGHSVASIGDVNGDGYGDILVGAPTYDFGLSENEGAAFLYLGSDSGFADVPASTLGEAGENHAAYGWSVAGAGDVNGDGYSDFVVGSYRRGGMTGRGIVYIYHGNASGTWATWNDTLSTPKDSSWFGYSVSSAEDLNADGFADLIVGAPRWSTSLWTFEGRAFIYLGSDTGLTHVPVDTLFPPGSETGHEFGWSVAGAGDVNRDGYSDVLVGAHYFDEPDSVSNPISDGYAVVYCGGQNGIENKFWERTGINSGDLFGSAVSSAGDVNADGYSDIIVSSLGYENGQGGEGRVDVFLGGLSTMTASQNIEGNQLNAHLGTSIGPAWDINEDGYDDILIGVRDWDATLDNVGKVELYPGSSSGTQASPCWTVISDDGGGRLGASVASAADVNGDGWPDIVGGAEGYHKGDLVGGAAFVYFANANGGLNRTPRQTKINGDPIYILGVLDSAESQFGLRALGRTAAGRDSTLLEWEVRVNQDPFQDVVEGQSSVLDTGTPVSDTGSAVVLSDTISGIPNNGARWQVRFSTDNPFFPRTPWFVAPYNSKMAIDLRIGALSTSVSTSDASPVSQYVVLGLPHPNPFNPTTTISYSLSKKAPVELNIYDIRGRLVRRLIRDHKEKGDHKAIWNGQTDGGRPVASGMYFVRLKAGKAEATRKVILIR